ncbi:hypothetical protein [Mesorhizobium sp.]|uniref:hypothetical protein n=1 Tax=Mesorhizobium sp. TaxID=1871066 RepID=UPI0025E29568|nr:hypothetical protein [Mesorhizobium sp.]
MVVKNSEGESRIGPFLFIAGSVRGGGGGSDECIARILPVTDAPTAIGRIDDIDPGVFGLMAGHAEFGDDPGGRADEGISGLDRCWAVSTQP